VGRSRVGGSAARQGCSLQSGPVFDGCRAGTDAVQEVPPPGSDRELPWPLRLSSTCPVPMLELHGVCVDETFAEAFGMAGARLVITADELEWATTAATEFCGNASSVIGCDSEAAIERELDADETPDG